jgi:hypothetical protein
LVECTAPVTHAPCPYRAAVWCGEAKRRGKAKTTCETCGVKARAERGEFGKKAKKR